MLPRALIDAGVSAACRVAGLLLHARRTALPDPAAPLRIAIIKPCCFGDVVMSTAAIAALRARFPTASITYITGRWSLPAVEHNPHLDHIVQWAGARSSLPGRLQDQAALLRLLRAGHYDVAVVLDRSPVIPVTALLAGIPVRAGLDSRGRGFALTHAAPATPFRHEAQLYLDVAAALGADAGGHLEYQPSAVDAAWAQRELGDRRWVAVHPGGGVNPGSTLTGKRWAVDRFRHLVQRLREAGRAVLVVGGPEDVALAASLADAGGAGPLRNLAGQASLGQLGAAYAHCDLFVGNDTGAMHLAVAAGVPVVAVFGPSRPAWYRPFSPRSRVIYHGEACSGCRFRGGLLEACAHDLSCMDLATVDEVAAACQDLLAEAAGVDA